MLFESIVLLMFSHLHGERSSQAVYHILRGKRSGQTMQDVEYYQLKPYYALLPNLSSDKFGELIEHLMEKGLITIEDQVVFLTASGQEQLSGRAWRFSGWEYRGGEREFFKRMALTIQTVSHLRLHEMMFIPIQKELHIQQFVKDFLRSQPAAAAGMASELKDELARVMTESGITELQSDILMYRLTGFGLTAYTWDQLSEALEMDTMSIQLLFLESLHVILDYIENHPYPLLKQLAAGCRVDTYLTHSAERTRKLFLQGFSIEQITSLRQLKRSTIEDHFIEMAANVKSFPYQQFVTEEQIQNVWQQIDRLQTKRLRILKEQCGELSYFQLRLIVAHGRQVMI